MTEDRAQWTVGDWIAHVGGVINDNDTVTFGSPMAVRAMLMQIQSIWADDCNNALLIAKAHIARVNAELAELRLAHYFAMEALQRVAVGPSCGAHATPGVH